MFKVVSYGRYKNLNKSKRISGIPKKISKLLIIVVLFIYNIQCIIEEHAIYKSVFIKKIKSYLLYRNLNINITIENVLRSKYCLSIMKGILAFTCFNCF